MDVPECSVGMWHDPLVVWDVSTFAFKRLLSSVDCELANDGNCPKDVAVEDDLMSVSMPENLNRLLMVSCPLRTLCCMN